MNTFAVGHSVGSVGVCLASGASCVAIPVAIPIAIPVPIRVASKTQGVGHLGNGLRLFETRTHTGRMVAPSRKLKAVRAGTRTKGIAAAIACKGCHHNHPAIHREQRLLPVGKGREVSTPNA